LTVIGRKSLKDEVVERVKEYILKGRYSPGQKIVIDSLAKDLGVSVTPVREALNYLAAEGLIDVEPHKGFSVKKWNRKEIEDLLLLRMYLERLAVRLFIERGYDENISILEQIVKEMSIAADSENLQRLLQLNTDFHNVIVMGSKNEELRKVISALRDKLYRVRVFSLSYPGRIKQSYQEHLQIYKAIKSKDIELSEKLMEEHIKCVRDVLIKRASEGLI
jgi:DNA-binding GntR family transcriptional regulator